MNLYTIMGQGFDPYYNLALEEYLLQHIPENGCILYLWQNDRTVVIGRNQNPWAECRTALLQEEGGCLARRLSGGGAVYHDLGNLNFTFLCEEQNFDIPKELSVIQKAVSYAGIRAEFSGRNDLLAGGKKFSGNAFYHSKGFSYHHGTLLISSDMEKLQRYLSPSKAKLQSKGIASVRSRITNLCDLSPALTCEAMKGYIQRAFGEIYGGTPVPLPLPEQEAILPLRTRYESESWLYGKPMPFSCRLSGSFPWGSLEMLLSVESGVIKGVQVYTDAMEHTLSEKLTNALTHCSFRARDMMMAVSPLENGTDIANFIKEQNI